MKYRLIIIFFLYVIFLFTRFFNLGKVPAWEDNFSWLYRINYYPWVIETNFKGTAENDKDLKYAGTISYHPGVTLMTFSGLSTRYSKKILNSYDPNYIPCEYNSPSCSYLGAELVIAKLPLILLSSLAFAGILYILMSFDMSTHIQSPAHIFLMKILTPLIFGLIVIFEPIFYSTSRDLHLDFLQSVFVVFAFTYMLLRNSTKTSIFAGINFGLATLTRFASLLFAPGFILVELTYHPNIQKIRKLVYFFIAGAVIFFIMYPPMWVAPFNTVKYMVLGSVDSTASHAHELQSTNYFAGFLQYFNGKETTLSIVWITLFISSLLHFLIAYKGDEITLNKILIFFTLYLLLLNMSDKKFFRYLTPVIMGYSIFISYMWSKIIYEVVNKLGLYKEKSL